MIEWLDDVWARTHAVQVVEGGEDGGPLPDRAVLAELRGAVSVDAARVLTTKGRFLGDICRCHGGPTIVLRDTAGEVLASAGLHGHGSVSWERSRFRNDLVVADPAALHLFLAGHGVPDQLASFLAPLADLLSLHEGRPQFRPAGKAGKRYLTERAVPDVLHPALVAVTGQQSGELSDTQVDDVRRRLTGAMPSPTGRAAVLLSWLGRLSVPAEALDRRRRNPHRTRRNGSGQPGHALRRRRHAGHRRQPDPASTVPTGTHARHRTVAVECSAAEPVADTGPAGRVRPRA